MSMSSIAPQRIILVVIVACYFATRFAVLSSSWDANRNWEEPVFLYSTVELQKDGLHEVFDHQDDLNHGGSVALLIAAAPWFRLFPLNLVGLKWLMILWSGLTLIVFLRVLTRYLSAPAAIAFGIFCVLLSPTLTRMNLTAVGSHPESLLLCGVAFASYLESERRSRRAASCWSSDLSLGLSGGLAVWFSYIAATFVFPLLLCHSVFRRDARASATAMAGVAVGLLPWVYQNLWLRPHGALIWRSRVASSAPDSPSLFARTTETFANLSASFGLPAAGGSIPLHIAVVILLVFAVMIVHRGLRKRLWRPPSLILPIVLIPCFGFLMLSVTDLKQSAGEGYYFYRFFIPLQVSLFVVFALALDAAWQSGLRALSAGIILFGLASGVWAQIPLYGLGNSYEPDSEAEVIRGCGVYGVAEGSRSGDAAVAFSKLMRISDPACRRRAFGGLGWWLAGQIRKAEGRSAVVDSLAALDDPALRRAACNGIRFVAKTFPDSQRKLVMAKSAPACAVVPSPVTTLETIAPANIILIVIDTLRADHLGSYGYARDTSPFLDSLATEGVVFEQARSNSSFTRESVAALMTGQLPSRSGAIGWDAYPPSSTPTIAERMKAAGYHTVFLSNTMMLKHERFTEGFDEALHLPRRIHLSGQGERLSQTAIDHLRRSKNKKNFFYLHYLDPHGPYEPNEVFDRRFPRELPEHPLHLYKELRPRLTELVEEGLAPGTIHFEDLRARYDAEISETDDAIKQLFAGLEKLGLSGDTLAVVTADHGEEFLDHGFVEHGWTLYEESIRVPLIFWAPGFLHAQRTDQAVSLVDVAPTLLSLLGVAYDDGSLNGRALFDAHAASAGTQRSVRKLDENHATIAETLIQERNLLRTVIAGNFKYLAALRWLSPAQRSTAATKAKELRARGSADHIDVWQEAVHEELYDLAHDPGEKHNILEPSAAAKPTNSNYSALVKRLAKYKRSCLAAPSHANEAPPSPEPLTPHEEEQLRSLGYM